MIYVNHLAQSLTHDKYLISARYIKASERMTLGILRLLEKLIMVLFRSCN